MAVDGGHGEQGLCSTCLSAPKQGQLTCVPGRRQGSRRLEKKPFWASGVVGLRWIHRRASCRQGMTLGL